MTFTQAEKQRMHNHAKDVYAQRHRPPTGFTDAGLADRRRTQASKFFTWTGRR